MTPEVMQLVKSARECLDEISELSSLSGIKSQPTVIRRCWHAIAAVEALDNPATAHATAIERRVAEDDGGRMHAQSMGIEE